MNKEEIVKFITEHEISIVTDNGVQVLADTDIVVKDNRIYFDHTSDLDTFEYITDEYERESKKPDPLF